MKIGTARLITGVSMAMLAAMPLLSTFSQTGEASERLDWSNLLTGKEVYNAACATCHGTNGRGADSTLLGFDPLPPDFTDCAFTSREMSSDWEGIAWGGGPMKGFSPMMPAFGEALSKPQIKQAIVHIKAFCPEKKWPPGEFNLPKAMNTGKAFPENEVGWSLSTTFSEPMTIEGDFVVARRIGARHQIEAGIPFAVQQVEYTTNSGEPELRWGEGAGDIVVAWKSVMWFSVPAGNIASITLDAFFPTGDEKDDLSDGIFAFEPALAIGQIIPYVGFLQLQGGIELSTNTDKKLHTVFWRGALGHSYRKGGYGRAVSPIIEFMGAKELSSKTSVEWDVVPQIQIALSQRQHVRLGVGLSLPITDFNDRQMKLMTYLIWDWYDGGFTEGWTQ